LGLYNRAQQCSHRAMILDAIEAAIAATGLVPRGSLRLAPDEADGDLAGKRSLVLIGLVGRSGWDSFAQSPEAQDGLADPLDRWSRRCIAALAQELGGTAIFPFGGPPYWPFQRWAQRAEPVHPSPLGLLIHPVHGLWHSYRGALAFAQELPVPPVPAVPSPCDNCPSRPCLTACPVGAFNAGGYDVPTCAAWLRIDQGQPCMERGCLARSACPVAPELAHQPDQASFGMRAYLASRG
jgi:hypothetical protein